MSAQKIKAVFLKALSLPAVYDLAQFSIGAPNLWRIFAEDYIKSKPGDKVLDLGCGFGRLIEHLPDGVDYLGVDVSEKYIQASKRKYGERGRFAVVDAAELKLEPMSCNLVFSCGMLHHIDDAAARAVFAQSYNVLKPGGRYVTYDPAFRKGQHPVAYWAAKMDRGAHVRTPEAYAALARSVFSDVTCNVREDSILRYPATSNFMICRRGENTSGQNQ